MNLLVVGHDLKFARDFIGLASISDDIFVKCFEYSGHEMPINNDLIELHNWADVVFCEWALGNAVWFSINKKINQFLFVRLHSQEIRGEYKAVYFDRINFSSVDGLIVISPFISSKIKSEVCESFLPKIFYVPNSIPKNLLSSRLIREKESRKYTIGMVGLVPALKRVDLAFDLIRKILAINDHFILRVKGKLPQDLVWMSSRKSELDWYRSIFDKNKDLINSGRVIFDEYSDLDMRIWYSSVGYILSTSDSEGSHQAVAEGMSCGCVPLIRLWPGADSLYPSRFIFNHIDDICSFVISDDGIAEYQDNSSYSSEFARANFDSRYTTIKLLNIVCSLSD